MLKIKILYISFLFLLVSCNYSHQIKKDPIFSIAKITGTKSDGRGYFYLIYEYYVNNVKYTKQQGQFSRCESKFYGKYFPVVYYKENPKHSILLVAPRDFVKWGIPYPDSLSWTYECTKGMFDL